MPDGFTFLARMQRASGLPLVGKPAWSLLNADEIRLALTQMHSSSPPAISGMLDAHQWTELAADQSLRVFAAFPGAQFRQLGNAAAAGPMIVTLPLDQFAEQQRSPRALRRKLLASACDESDIGDLAVSGDQAWLTVPDTDWLSVSGVTFIKQTEWKPLAPAASKASVASMRLDALVARLFAVGRSEAHTAITHGFVFVDFQQQLRPARQVSVGCVIVFRGLGRVELIDAAKNSRSGRLIVSYAAWPV